MSDALYGLVAGKTVAWAKRHTNEYGYHYGMDSKGYVCSTFVQAAVEHALCTSFGGTCDIYRLAKKLQENGYGIYRRGIDTCDPAIRPGDILICFGNPYEHTIIAVNDGFIGAENSTRGIIHFSKTWYPSDCSWSLYRYGIDSPLTGY